MIYVEDDNGGILEFPDDTITGHKKNQDGSITFKLLGGPYHDMMIRVYKLGEPVTFPNGETYVLHPPAKNSRSKHWVYVHQLPGSGPITALNRKQDA